MQHQHAKTGDNRRGVAMAGTKARVEMVFTSEQRGTVQRIKTGLLISGLVLSLAACQSTGDGGNFSLFKKKPDGALGTDQATSVKLIERDIEAPDVFQRKEAGLWDGRPSLGGVWVAHPDVTDPERVIIRNESNGKFVIGALFRRERENPGPRFQVSSDAAAALTLLAGQPVELSVTALRREEVVEDLPATPSPAELPEASDISQSTLDPIDGAAAAIDAAEAAEAPAAPAPKPAASALAKPYLQIGIFSVEANAKTAAKQMEKAGMPAVIKEQSLKGKTYWRVLVGPAQSAAARTNLLDQIKSAGFTDAYAVTN